MKRIIAGSVMALASAAAVAGSTPAPIMNAFGGSVGSTAPAGGTGATENTVLPIGSRLPGAYAAGIANGGVPNADGTLNVELNGMALVIDKNDTVVR